jgi:hypothetical protein
MRRLIAFASETECLTQRSAIAAKPRRGTREMFSLLRLPALSAESHVYPVNALGVQLTRLRPCVSNAPAKMLRDAPPSLNSA